MDETANKLIEFLLENGAADAGICDFSKLDENITFDNDTKLNTVVSIVIKFSDAVVDEITDKPTFTYFHHYRTMNAFIDNLLLKAGFFIEKNGYKYTAIAASQTVEKGDNVPKGRYSHKKAAVLSGLGFIGKNAMFIHKDYGARVRLGTIFTDMPYNKENPKIMNNNFCENCGICVKSCPSMALNGESFDIENPQKFIIDANACSNYMKSEFMNIGRGAVCGICMKVCPYYKLKG